MLVDNNILVDNDTSGPYVVIKCYRGLIDKVEIFEDKPAAIIGALEEAQIYLLEESDSYVTIYATSPNGPGTHLMSLPNTDSPCIVVWVKRHNYYTTVRVTEDGNENIAYYSLFYRKPDANEYAEKLVRLLEPMASTLELKWE